MSPRVNIGDAVKNLRTDGQQVVNDLKALAQAEVKPIVKNAGIGGGAFGAAGYFAINAASLLFIAGGFAFSLIFLKAVGWGAVVSLLLGFICMALVLLAIAGILALVGRGAIKKVGPPKQTIAEAKATVETLKASVQRGQETVAANSLARAQGTELTPLRRQSTDA